MMIFSSGEDKYLHLSSPGLYSRTWATKISGMGAPAFIRNIII